MEEQDKLDLGGVVALLNGKRFPALRAGLCDLAPTDIAEIIAELEPLQRSILFRLLPKELAAEVFVELESDLQQELIASFTDAELRLILDELFVDDTVDIIEEMPANVVKRILRNCDTESRTAINEILKYPEDSAGSIMTTEYVDLKRNMTVDQAFSYIREVAIDKETIYTCYVTDANRCLIGVVSVKNLLLADRSAIVGDIMEDHVISVSTLEDRESTAQLIGKYDVLALPVVDAEDRLVGIVTVDDAIDVIHEETEEDFAKMAAITPDETPYLKMSVFGIWRARIPWLMLLMISATFTGMIITSFEEALARVVVLTAFIPMLMDTGGNSGSQASVTVIRGLSLGEIKFKDTLRVVWKEMRVSVLCAASLSAVAFLKIYLVDGLLLHTAGITFWVMLTVSATLFLTVVCAKLIGCTLPLLAKKLGFDPAVMASPIITTLVDAISLLVYFGMATVLLGL